MPTHNQLAAQLLRDSANFFRTLGEQNPPLKDQMAENAAVFEEVAMLVENDPLGEIAGGHSHGGGCCGGGHHHHDHEHSHDEPCEDKGKKEGCDGNGGCGCH